MEFLRRWIRLLINISFVALVSLPFFYGQQPIDWFALHPLCMSIAFSLIAPQAVHLFSNRNGFMRHASPSRRVEAHRYLIILTLAAASLGFLGIFVHKTRLDKRHFLTWHSWLGAATLLVFLGQGVGGSLLYYRFLARRFASLHAVGALLSFSLAVGALLLACWSNWARATFTPPLLVALLLLPATNLTELLQQLMQAGRFPRAYRSLFGESKSMGCRR